MRLKSGQLWFIAFTAVFATAAVFIFWGAWSIGISPVMPDCPLPRSENFISSWLDGWARSGKFIPDDIRVFLGPPAFWAELQYVLAAFSPRWAWFITAAGAAFRGSRPTVPG